MAKYNDLPKGCDQPTLERSFLGTVNQLKKLEPTFISFVQSFDQS